MSTVNFAKFSEGVEDDWKQKFLFRMFFVLLVMQVLTGLYCL